MLHLFVRSVIIYSSGFHFFSHTVHPRVGWGGKFT